MHLKLTQYNKLAILQLKVFLKGKEKLMYFQHVAMKEY